MARFRSHPPDFISPIVRYEADEQAQNVVYDAWEVDSVEQKFKLCRKALKVFPFSVDALNCMGNLYSSSFPDEGDAALEKAEKTYELAVEAANLLWPELKDQELVEWGHVEHRPFLRSYHGLGCVQNDRGKPKKSLEKYRFLLRVNPSDNQGVRTLLFYNLIELGEYNEAEKIAEQHSNGRKSTESYFLYGFVLIDFLKFKLGCCSPKVFEETVMKAIQSNSHVIPLLLSGDMPDRPGTYSPGGLDEAKSLVNMTKRPLGRIPGVLEWLEEARFRSGMKPDDDGSILFSLLEKGKVLVEMDGGNELLLTSNVRLMPGKGLKEFRLAPGMKDHNPERIVTFDEAADRGQGDFLSSFVAFRYSEVNSIPFWNLLLNCDKFGSEDDVEHHCNKCYEPATKKCSRCGVTWYCSESCQRKDWLGDGSSWDPGHKLMCKKFIKC